MAPSLDANEYATRLRRALAGRTDVTISERELMHGQAAYPFLRIASTEIGPEDRLLLLTAGFHGDERAGPLSMLEHADAIIGEAHAAGLKIILYPLVNPSGFAAGTRYNIEGDLGESGNNDFLRYEREDGSFAAELGLGERFKSWRWSVEATARLPRETRLLASLLRQDPLGQVVAFVDLHQDCFLRGSGAYQYAFGEHARYAAIAKQVRALVPILSDQVISSGYQVAAQQPSDEDGFLIRNDGSIGDLFHRLGAAHALTVETLGDTPMEIACQVNRIWVSGIIRLVQQALR